MNLNYNHLVPNLPKGVSVARLGLAGSNEFELYGDKIQKGPRPGAQVIVVPDPGFEFVFDIENNCYAAKAKAVPTAAQAIAGSEVELVSEPHQEEPQK